jgi:hypothetical protein
MAVTHGLSSSTKGTNREEQVRELLGPILPPIVRIESGDIIDGKGNSSGQVDAICIHQMFPSMRLGKGPGFVFAESAVTAIEVKSDLTSQWNEVRDKWKKLIRLRRNLQGWVSYGASLEPNAAMIPFTVIAWKGWAQCETLAKHMEEMFSDLTEAPSPHVVIYSVDPPMLGVKGNAVKGRTFELGPAERGVALINVWAQISERARQMATNGIPWDEYLGPPPKIEK